MTDRFCHCFSRIFNGFCVFRHVQTDLLMYLGSICLSVSQLNNRLFEELAMDVYDEVDRRENDAGEPHLRSLFAFF